MNTTKKSYTSVLVLLTSLFFIWGFITCLNNILIPHLKALFDLNYTKVMLIQFCFFGAYFIMSMPSGWIVEKVGYQKGIVLGLAITGVGAFLFYPASVIISYNLFLFALFTLASGITLLQVSANPYVAILGNPETASSRLNLTQAFNSLGTTIAPILGAYLILTQADISTIDKAAKVQGPYIYIAIVLFIITAVFWFVKLPTIESKKDEKTEGSVWQYRHLILGAIAIFMYVGAEVAIGSFLINYISGEITDLTESQAGRYVSLYWGGAMVGRFIGAALLQKIKASKLLTFNALMIIVLLLVTMFSSGQIALWSIIVVGLFNSIMFSNIFTMAIYKLGKHTSKGSGILCMAIVGGAIVPLIMGTIADKIGIQKSLFIATICYAYIFYYGFKGYRVIAVSKEDETELVSASEEMEINSESEVL